jgi:hypothetical protein
MFCSKTSLLAAYFADNAHVQTDGFALHSYQISENFIYRHNWVVDSILGGYRFDAAEGKKTQCDGPIGLLFLPIFFTFFSQPYKSYLCPP